MKEVFTMTPFLQSIYDIKNDAVEHQKYCKRRIKRLNEERNEDEILTLIIFILTHLLTFVKIFIYDSYNPVRMWH